MVAATLSAVSVTACAFSTGIILPLSSETVRFDGLAAVIRSSF
jgi:hypothetical protein